MDPPPPHTHTQINQITFEQNVVIVQDVSTTQCDDFPPLSPPPPPSTTSLPRTAGCSTAPPRLHTAVLVTMAANSLSFFFFLGHVSVCALTPYTLTYTFSCDVGGLSLRSPLAS